MRTSKPIAASLLAFAIALSGAPLFATDGGGLYGPPQGPPPGPPKDGPKGPPPELVLKEILGLSDGQMATLKSLQEARRASMEALMPQIQEKEKALRDALAAAEPDPAVVGPLVVAIEKLRKQGPAIEKTFRDGFSAMLTADQTQKVEQIHAVEKALMGAGALQAIGL